MRLAFDKMEGAGNDFIFIDNRDGKVPDEAKPALAVKYCHRRFGIGADGMVFVQEDPEFDFAWDFFNSDGSRAEMCGNGARCAARFANKIGAAGSHMVFRTLASPIKAEITERGAKVKLTNARIPEASELVEVDGKRLELWSLNTGVPHTVVRVEDVEGAEVERLGALIRYHAHFAPAGVNVNFIRLGDGDTLSIRTYERGVEAETLACGTGSTASSIVAARFFGKRSPVTVTTRGGGELVIHFTLADGEARDVFLEGAANWVFSGFIEPAKFM